MLRRRLIAPFAAALTVALPLAGCMSVPEQGPDMAPAEAGPVMEMEVPEGPYIWACAVPDETTGAGWVFTIAAQANETGQELVLQIPGSGGAMPLGRRIEDQVEIYESGGTRIAIAPDGAAQVAWPGQATSFASQCLAGDTA